ncbi:MAG: hypothetical protein ACRYGA_09480 [Janthinobacterium lividum]
MSTMGAGAVTARTPMQRVSYRFGNDVLRLLDALATAAGVSDAEYLRRLVRQAAAGTPQSTKKKHKRPRPPHALQIVALHPDARLMLIRAVQLLDEIARELQSSRYSNATLEVVGVAAQLLIAQETLHEIADRQLQIARTGGSSS